MIPDPTEAANDRAYREYLGECPYAPPGQPWCKVNYENGRCERCGRDMEEEDEDD